MAESHFTTLTEGSIYIGAVARAIADAPALRGVGDLCMVRSVLVMGQSGRWVNHCTVIHVGAAASSVQNEVEDRILGNARLLGLFRPVATIRNDADVIDLLTAWRITLPDDYLQSVQAATLGPAVQPLPWQFQQNGNAYHYPSKNEWGVPPVWVIDLHDMQGTDRGMALPRGPFRDRTTSGVTNDVGGLVTKWCNDRTWRQFSSVQNAYRVIIPDHRGLIDEVVINQRRVHVGVGRSNSLGLECALTGADQKGNEFSETKHVSGESVEFELPTGAQSVELYLLDESDEWCDRYRWLRPDFSSFVQPEVQEAPAPQQDELLQQLLAPRYAAVRAQYSKALEISRPCNPDYINAAKELVCAVESIAKIWSGKHNSTLGQIIKFLKKEKRIDPATATDLTTFWANANRLPNVRHGAVTDRSISVKEFEAVLEKAQAAIRYFLERDL